jgi:hypothetical protein
VVDWAMRVRQRTQTLCGPSQRKTTKFDCGADYQSEYGVVAPSDYL